MRARPLITLLVVVLGAAGLIGAVALQAELSRALTWWDGHFEGAFVEIYLDDAMTEDAGMELREHLAADNRVLSATYISAADAQAEAEGYLGPMAFSVLPENPLPASLRLEITPESKSGPVVRQLVDSLAAVPGIAEIVSADQQLALYSQGRETITTYSRSLIMVAALWIGVWLFCGIYLIARVRAPETRIWSYLGARPGWFRWPVIVEGVVLGLGTSLVAGVVLTWGNSPIPFDGAPADVLPMGLPVLLVVPALSGAIAGWLAYRVQRMRAVSH